MVNERLVWYLEKNGLLAKQQCGYRANRSTVDQLIRLETFIRDAFIQNQHLVAVFFDLQKAYDTTWKHGIQQDLHDMGLRGNLLIFIGNFLTDRTFQIHLGTILSDVFHQEEGVPQGAILSTTLLPEASYGLRVLSLPASVCVCVCMCVCVSVNHEFVRAITHHPFKLRSPNLDHRCKRPWLRSLLFWGVIDLDLQGRI